MGNETLQATVSAASAGTSEPTLPDYLNRFRTKNTIPSFFRDAGSLPDRLAVADDRTPATKVVNQSYERQKKIEQKRATENAIQKVTAIEKTTSAAKLSSEEKKQSPSSKKAGGDKDKELLSENGGGK